MGENLKAKIGESDGKPGKSNLLTKIQKASTPINDFINVLIHAMKTIFFIADANESPTSLCFACTESLLCASAIKLCTVKVVCHLRENGHNF